MASEPDTQPGGLTQAEGARRLQAEGPNELSPPRRRTLWHIALEMAREPMFQLLVAAGVICLVLGNPGVASEIGRIDRALGEIETPATPLQRQTRRLVRVFSVLGLSLSAVVVVLYGLLRGDWMAGLLVLEWLKHAVIRPGRSASG